MNTIANKFPHFAVAISQVASHMARDYAVSEDKFIAIAEKHIEAARVTSQHNHISENDRLMLEMFSRLEDVLGRENALKCVTIAAMAVPWLKGWLKPEEITSYEISVYACISKVYREAYGNMSKDAHDEALVVLPPLTLVREDDMAWDCEDFIYAAKRCAHRIGELGHADAFLMRYSLGRNIQAVGITPYASPEEMMDIIGRAVGDKA